MPDSTATVHRFVILAAPRSGSNLLCTMLQSHPDVLCHHEVFNPDGVYVAVPLRNTDFSLGCKQQRDANPMHFLASLWSQNLGCSHVGFKMTHKQHLGAFKAVCEDSDIHKIVLTRRNQIAVYVSRLIAEHTGIWEDYRIGEVSPLQSVHVEADKLLEAVRFNQDYYIELKTRVAGNVTYIDYEELFNPEEQYRLLTALGLPLCALKAGSRKQNPYPLSELIENFSQLKAQLSRNPSTHSLVSELET